MCRVQDREFLQTRCRRLRRGIVKKEMLDGYGDEVYCMKKRRRKEKVLTRTNVFQAVDTARVD